MVKAFVDILLTNLMVMLHASVIQAIQAEFSNDNFDSIPKCIRNLFS